MGSGVEVDVVDAVAVARGREAGRERNALISPSRMRALWLSADSNHLGTGFRHGFNDTLRFCISFGDNRRNGCLQIGSLFGIDPKARLTRNEPFRVTNFPVRPGQSKGDVHTENR
jgi:hypothetical protein